MIPVQIFLDLDNTSLSKLTTRIMASKSEMIVLISSLGLGEELMSAGSLEFVKFDLLLSGALKSNPRNFFDTKFIGYSEKFEAVGFRVQWPTGKRMCRVVAPWRIVQTNSAREFGRSIDRYGGNEDRQALAAG